MKKKFLFVACTIATLIIGTIGSFVLWKTTHHRYASPKSGFYRGHVIARFQGVGDAFYSCCFTAETPLKWRWDSHQGFRYELLSFGWQGETSDGVAVLNYPAGEFQSTNSTGVLNSTVLTHWLLGRAHDSLSSNELQCMNMILGFIEAAGDGSFPPPNHHGYHYDQPVSTYIQHFKTGFGIPSYTYIWWAIWLVLAIFTARLVFTKPEQHD